MAQSAVLLDQVNDIAGAIGAYTQSVRLLKDVMARVEEGAATTRERELERERRRARRGTVETEGERQDRERREERLRRRENARLEEARRLRMIVRDHFVF
jgi:hypothetical protein